MNYIDYPALKDRALHSDSMTCVCTLNSQIYANYRRGLFDLNGFVITNDSRLFYVVDSVFRRRDVPLLQGSELILRVLSDAEVRDSVTIVGGTQLSHRNAEMRSLAAYSVSPEFLRPEEFASTDELASAIDATHAKFVFICLGSPKQEILIRELSVKLAKPTVMIGAGGAVDFLAGSIRRAPWIVRMCLLEGVWRFMVEPSFKRLKRVFISLYGAALYIKYDIKDAG